MLKIQGCSWIVGGYHRVQQVNKKWKSQGGSEILPISSHTNNYEKENHFDSFLYKTFISHTPISNTLIPEGEFFWGNIFQHSPSHTLNNIMLIKKALRIFIINSCHVPKSLMTSNIPIKRNITSKITAS